jgi:deoxyadenosine/deoxycytidine kinase
LNFRYLAIEGPIGLGKTALAERLGARLDATVVLDDRDNPFLDDFYAGRSGAAFQTQLFFTLARHRQLLALRQGDLFSQTTICDYLFERDRVYAFLNLDDNELFIYQRLFELVARDLPVPDLVIYLQLNEAYNYFFFHYTATPLLVVETSQLDLTWGDETLDDLLKQVDGMARGTRYYVPHTGSESSG